MSKRRVLGTLAALLGVTGAAPAPPAQLPPVAIIHEAAPRPRRVRPMREVPKTPAPIARRRLAGEKRAAKRAYRAARRRGAPVGWRRARALAFFHAYLMSGGSRAAWRDVHGRMEGML